MKTDDRDERLGAILRETIVDVGLNPVDPTIVMRRGSRRRAGGAIASIMVVGVFVGAVALAAAGFGQDAGVPRRQAPPGPSTPPEGWTERVAGQGRFETEVLFPERWAFQDADGLVLDSPTQPIFRLATSRDVLRGVACGSLEILPGVPTILIGREPLGPFEALLSVHAYTGAGWLQPHRVPDFAPRPSRLAWADAQSARIHDCGRRAEMFTFFIQDGARWIFHVTMGAAVMDSRVADDLLEVMNGIVLPPDADAPIRFLPSETWVSDFTNEPGGTPAWTSKGEMTAGEATFPDAADLSEDGILVTVFQVGEASIDPAHVNFVPDGLPLDLPEEIETSWEGYGEADGRSRSTLLVVVNGRALQIHVYYGTTEPSEEMLVEAEAALKRLVVRPVPAPATLPPPVRDDYRSEFVSDERGYRFWPRSARVERGVVYRFQVPHCGLGWLVDFDGSFWEARETVDYPTWVPADSIPDGDVGTIELSGVAGARYEASEGSWTLLSRVDGPVVRQLCE